MFIRLTTALREWCSYHSAQDSELALLRDMSHLQAIKQDLALVTSNPHRLPDKSVQVVEVGKERGGGGGEVSSERVLCALLVCASASPVPVLGPSLLSVVEHNPSQ